VLRITTSVALHGRFVVGRSCAV